MKRLLASWLLACCATNPIFASEESSEDSAVEASRLVVAAWECHVIGELAGYDGNLERLFQIGMRQGNLYFDALEAEQISPEAADESVPLYWSLVGGRSREFVLGRLYQAIHEEVWGDLLRRGILLDKEVRKVELTAKFERSNCELLKD